MSRTASLIIAIVAVVVIAAGAVIIFNNRTAGDDKGDSTANTSDSSELADDEIAATITYTNSGFSPATVTVQSGSAIRIVNQSDSAVGPSSDPHPIHNLNSELNFPDIEPGQSGTMVVTKKGTWGYHNHFKEDHHATIVVE